MRTLFIIILVIFAIATIQEANGKSINGDYSTAYDIIERKEKEWKEITRVFSTGEFADLLNGGVYDVRSNETGQFTGAFNGTWHKFTYALWSVTGHNASALKYMIQDIEVANQKFLVAIYSKVQVMGGKGTGEWEADINGRLYRVNANETDTTIANAVGVGNGQLNFTESGSGVSKQHTVLHINTTSSKAKLESVSEVNMKASEGHLSWSGWNNGTCKTEGDGKVEAESLIDQIIQEAFMDAANVNWTTHHSGNKVNNGGLAEYSYEYTQTQVRPSATSKYLGKADGFISSKQQPSYIGLNDGFNDLFPPALDFFL